MLLQRFACDPYYTTPVKPIASYVLLAYIMNEFKQFIIDNNEASVYNRVGAFTLCKGLEQLV